MSKNVRLSEKEKGYLRNFKKSGDLSLREFNRATILIFLDKGLSVSQIENLLEVDRTTIWRIKTKYLENGIERALIDEERPGQPKKYTLDHELEIIALAKSPAPKGRSRWTIRLLVEKLHRREGFETITYGTVRNILKEHNIQLN